MGASIMEPKRMWVNQPSTLQPDHDLHGTNVIAVPKALDHYNCDYEIFFLDGNTISRPVNHLSLSEGWIKK